MATNQPQPPWQRYPFVDSIRKLTPDALNFLQTIIDTLEGQDESGVIKVTLGPVNISVGTGSPNGVVTGSPGHLYLNAAGGALTTLYVKESGTDTSAGWVGK